MRHTTQSWVAANAPSRKNAQYWAYSSAAVINVIAANQMKRGRRTACHTARYPSSTSTIVSMYIRVSVEYRMAYGDAATMSNALHAVQRDRSGSPPPSRLPEK